MSNTFRIKDSRGTVIATISETGKDTSSTSLILHGRGNKNYGLDRNRNLVQLLENFANDTPPANPKEGQLWWKTGQLFFVRDESGSPMWQRLIPASGGVGFNVVAGAGLTGGGFPSGSPLTTTLNVGQGTGITVSADNISTNDSEIVHSNLSGFFANEHINHASVNLTAGNGLTGGGTIAASRTFNAGAGTGITVAADTISLNSNVVRTAGNQTLNNVRIFTDTVLLPDGSAGAPAAAFNTDTDTGIYRSGPGELSFSTGGIQRFRIESNGVLRSLNSTYETLVTEDDDIPNKKYVDDTAGASVAPTSNTFTGTTFLSGLTIGKKYLVHIYGTTLDKGTGTATLGSVRLTQGTSPGSGSLVAGTATILINWHDGQMTQSATFIVTAPSTNVAGATDYTSSGSFATPLYMSAIQLD